MTTKIAGGEELREVVTSAKDIVKHIERQSKSRSDSMIGMEYERAGVYTSSGKAISYDTIERILDTVAERDGWQRGLENNRIIYLEKNNGAGHRGRDLPASSGEMITLEPGGQTEYSSAPAKTISELMANAGRVLRVVDSIARERGVTYLGIGYQPFSHEDEVDWVPKARYQAMAPYLQKRGRLAGKMMKMTAGCQVSLDFADGADAMRKLRAALLCTPIAQALFASSGIAVGGTIPYQDWRAKVWTETDDERCNIPAFMLRADAALEEYVEWLLDMPLMFVEKNGIYRDGTGWNLRRQMKEATPADPVRIYEVESAMTQAFPEARLKRYVEVRSTDTPQPYLLGTIPCFWTSLLYGDVDSIFDLLGKINPEDFSAMRRSAMRDGLKGEAAGRSMAEWARDLLAIAGVTSTCEQNMARLKERALSGETPAEKARELLIKSGHPSEFVERWNKL